MDGAAVYIQDNIIAVVFILVNHYNISSLSYNIITTVRAGVRSFRSFSI